MSGNFWIHQALRLLLFLSLAPIACNLTAATNSSPLVSSKSLAKYDLSGVWAGISITSCTPLRMTGPWRCGAKADIKLTFIKERATITGIYASVRGSAGERFRANGPHCRDAGKKRNEVVVARDHARPFELFIQ
jgi:hypothetical protein